MGKKKRSDSSDKRRSWLDGPTIPGEADPRRSSAWPGEKLGLPKEGPGSLASVMRRAGGVCIDWGFCYVAGYFMSSTLNHVVSPAVVIPFLFFIVGTFSVSLLARTPGHAALGMGVARIDATTRVGLWRAAARTSLTLLIFPAAMVDEDGRGIHDRVTRTAVIMG